MNKLKNNKNSHNKYNRKYFLFKDSVELIKSNKSEREKILFPNEKTTENLSKMQKRIKLNFINKDGNKFSRFLIIHEKLAPILQSLINELIDLGLRFDSNRKQIIGYNSRNINGTKRISHHSFGTAIDLNIRDNRGDRNKNIKPRKEYKSYRITRKYVPIFRKYGFNRGGYFKDLGSDPMHISFLEIGDNDPQSPNYKNKK